MLVWIEMFSVEMGLLRMMIFGLVDRVLVMLMC